VGGREWDVELLLILWSIFRCRSIRSADSNRSNSIILKLDDKLPIVGTKLPRHCDEPIGWTFTTESEGVCAVLPIRFNNFSAQSTDSDGISNPK
jgi:hypothetical protein